MIRNVEVEKNTSDGTSPMPQFQVGNDWTLNLVICWSFVGFKLMFP